MHNDDRLVDIGAGTAGVTYLIGKKAGDISIHYVNFHYIQLYITGLQMPILAVDPSTHLLEIAKKREGIVTMQATFDEFLDSKQVLDYNKILICRSVHHFPHLQAAFKKLYDKMHPESQLLIIKNPETLLWEEVKKLCRPLSVDTMEEYLKDAGFDVEKGEESYVHCYSKEEYFQHLRQRCFSVLEMLSDEEIEEGIKKLNDTDFKGVSSKDLPDYYFLLKATKK